MPFVDHVCETWTGAKELTVLHLGHMTAWANNVRHSKLVPLGARRLALNPSSWIEESTLVSRDCFASSEF